MKEEKIKTRHNINIINEISSNNQEINVSSQSEMNNVQIATNSINIDFNNDKTMNFTYGKYKIFLYDLKGDPLFLIGPDYSYFISMLIMNIIYCIFFNYLLITIANFYIAIIGIIINILQLLSFILSSIKNPGLPKKQMQNELLLTKEPDKYKRCDLCSFIIEKNKKYFHCNLCGCCCEGYDHHCPWTSKCVGRGNIFCFNVMIFMVSIIFVYDIFAFVISKPKKRC